MVLRKTHVYNRSLTRGRNWSGLCQTFRLQSLNLQLVKLSRAIGISPASISSSFCSAAVELSNQGPVSLGPVPFCPSVFSFLSFSLFFSRAPHLHAVLFYSSRFLFFFPPSTTCFCAFFLFLHLHNPTSARLSPVPF